MSVNNGVIPKTGSVSIADVQEVLNTNESDLGQLCIHKNINPNARFKPVHKDYQDWGGYRVPEVGTLDDVRRFVTFGEINDDFYNELSDTNFWKYVPKSEKFNLNEFRGYNHNETGPIFRLQYKVNNVLTDLNEITELQRNDTIEFEILNGVFSIKQDNSDNPSNFNGAGNYYAGLLFINNTDVFILSSDNIIKQSSRILVKNNLYSIKPGEYKVIPVLINVEGRKNLHSKDLRIVFLLGQDFFKKEEDDEDITDKIATINVVGNLQENLFLTFDGYNKVKRSGQEYYYINCYVHNRGTQQELFKIKNVSYGLYPYVWDGVEISNETITLSNYDVNDYLNLPTTIEINEVIPFRVITSASSIINLRLSLYRTSDNGDEFVQEYTYNIGEENWKTSLKLYLLGLDSDNVDHPSNKDNYFDMAWRGIVPVISEGYGYNGLSVTYDQTTSVYPIYIDDYAVAFCRTYPDAPKDRIDCTNVSIKASNSNIDTKLQTQFYSGYTPGCEGQLSGNMVSKVIRIPWNGTNGYKYTTGQYYPQDLCSTIYTENPELNIRNYRSKYYDEPEFKEKSEYPYTDLYIVRNGIIRKLYYSFGINNTSKYRTLCVNFFRYITFIQEPYSIRRIYYGNPPFDAKYIFDENVQNGTIQNYDYLFSTINSKVINDYDIEYTGSLPKGGYICFPTNTYALDEVKSGQLILDDYTIVTEEYMWGDQLYTIIKVDYNNCTFKLGRL